MENFKIYQIVVLIAILCHQSSSLPREKRSFWPFFGGGGGNTEAVETPEPEVVEADEAVEQHVELPVQQQLPEAAYQHYVQLPVQQQQPGTAYQHLSPGYSYPIYRVHRYNGFELRPLTPQQHLQQLHTQVAHGPLQHRQQMQQFQPSIVQNSDFAGALQPNGQQFQQFQPNQIQNSQFAGSRQPNGQQNIANSNCQPKTAPVPIPPELQDLAQQFGIKDASKLPSLDDAMGLLGTTTRAETIQTIRELAATPDGMNLVRQFLASDDGAAASQDPSVDNQCAEAPGTQQFDIPQSSNANVPHRQIPAPNTIQQQQYLLPYPARQHDVYGLPNAYRANSFNGNQGIPQQPTHIMSLIKNEAVHNEYGVPNELYTAQSVHQGYNGPKQNGHETYDLPNTQSVAQFQQGYYASRSNQVNQVQSEGVPHEKYNVPNEASNSGSQSQENSGSQSQGPHKEYGIPSGGASFGSEQQQAYGVPNVQEPVNFQQPASFPQPVTNTDQQGLYPPETDAETPHEVYGVPKREESNTGTQQEAYGLPNVEEPVNFLQQGLYPPETDAEKPHEVYGVPEREESNAGTQQEADGLPYIQEPVNFLQQGLYPPETDNSESAGNTAGVPHKEYNVPNEDKHQTQIPHEIYGIPSDVQDQNVLEPPQQTYGAPNNENGNVQQDQQVVNNEHTAPSLNTQVSNTVGNTVPHTVFALPHQRFFETDWRKSQQRYGAPTKYTSNNQLQSIPILRQIDGTLDRANTNLELGQLLTTTVRPEAGFLERVGAWTKYFAPPGPTIPIVPPQVTEDVNESVSQPQNAYTIPISKLPQLPNAYIPRKFLQPPQSNQGPFIRTQRPTFNSLNTFEVPPRQPQPFDGQSVQDFVPDISQLPLDQNHVSNSFRTSYGTPTHAADSSAAASETDEQHVAVVLPNQSIRHEEIIDNDVVAEEPYRIYGPQRISSYDSYATGKLSRASDEAIIQLIPTQKPSTDYGRRLGQVEESSIIDSIATMTSGFRPITNFNQ